MRKSTRLTVATASGARSGADRGRGRAPQLWQAAEHALSTWQRGTRARPGGGARQRAFRPSACHPPADSAPVSHEVTTRERTNCRDRPSEPADPSSSSPGSAFPAALACGHGPQVKRGGCESTFLEISGSGHDCALMLLAALCGRPWRQLWLGVVGPIQSSAGSMISPRTPLSGPIGVSTTWGLPERKASHRLRRRRSACLALRVEDAMLGARTDALSERDSRWLGRVSPGRRGAWSSNSDAERLRQPEQNHRR